MSDRRGRGYLAHDVNLLLKQVVTGEVQLAGKWGSRLTPRAIARLLQEVDGLDELPSSGAIADILKRWNKIGYADILSGPLQFRDFTEEGRKYGLDEMNRRYEEFLATLPPEVKDLEKERLEQHRAEQLARRAAIKAEHARKLDALGGNKNRPELPF
jgi:hypothetical protein